MRETFSAGRSPLLVMSLGRSITWGLGAILVLVGIGLLLVETGLASWIPPAILGAGIIVVLGIIVMGMANKRTGGSGGAPPTTADAGEDEDPQIIKVE